MPIAAIVTVVPSTVSIGATGAFGTVRQLELGLIGLWPATPDTNLAEN